MQRVHIIGFAVPPAAEGGYAVRERMHDHGVAGRQRHEYGPVRVYNVERRGGLGLGLALASARLSVATSAKKTAELSRPRTVYLSTRRSGVTLELSIYSAVGGRARDIRSDRRLLFDVKCAVNMKAAARETGKTLAPSRARD